MKNIKFDDENLHLKTRWQRRSRSLRLMDPPSPNPSAANADAALPEFGVAQDLSVFDYIDHLSPLQSVIPSNLAHCFPGLSNSSVASTSSQPKDGDKTGLESRPQSFQYSVVDVPLNGDIPAEPQLPVVSASESSAVVTSGENTSGSDVMVQAQPRLSSNDGCWDNEEVICSSILHPADRKVDDEPKSVHCVSSNMLNGSNPLDAEKDFMAEVDKDVNFSSMIEQAGVDLGTSHATSWELAQNNKAQHASNDNKKLHADLQDQSGEPIDHQNKVTGSPGFRSQNADESLSGLPVHDCSGGTFMKRSMRKLKLSDFKASEEKHGMLRGCLQFKNDMNYSKGLLSNEPGTNLQRVLIQVVPAKLTKDSYQSERSSFSYHAGKSPAVNIRKGAGFGLHLNRVAETLPIASTGTHYQGDMHDASIKPLELTYIKQTHEVQNAEILKGVIPRNVYTKQGYEGSPGVLSNHRSSHGANKIFLNKDISTSHGANKILLNEDISTESWHGKRKLKPGNDDSFDDLKENDSKRKRTDSDATGGCKRCKCKRTRCLKLYCDCFMAGIYCAGSCSCQDCSNKPEFEELVFSTRQQIMSRNPLAFSPKIVESGSESLPNNANVIRLTPSAARHKRGCNCKKSMCFKKYCECYQAKVGCSDGCRCEGCKNIYGKRAGHNDFQEVSISRTVQGFGGTSDEHMKADTKKTFISQTDFSKLNYHELVTESLQSTQDEVSVSSSGHLPLRSLSLPDSSMTSCNENFSRSPLNSDSHDMPLSSSSNSTRQVSYECKSHSNSSEKKNDLQLSYDAEGSHSPPNNKFSASSGTGELKKDPGAQLSHDRRVGWSRTPILLGSTKSHLTNENGCNLSEIREDEPGILCNSTPVNDVNVRSLNRRRLSPRKPLIALHNLGSGTSNTLKCARKFILKSVPTSQAPPPVNAKNKEQGELLE